MLVLKKSIVLTLWCALSLAGFQTSAEEPDAEGTPPDRYAIPDGDAEELIEFMRGLARARPLDDEAREKTLAALNEAADRVLAGEATDEQVQAVVELKMSLLRGQPEQLAALAEKLAGAGREQLARRVNGYLLMAELRASMRGPREEALPTIEKVIGQVSEFLEAGPLAASDVQLGMMAAQVAEMAGNEELALDVYRNLSRLTAESEDPRLADLSKTLDGVVRRLTLVGNPMKIEGTTLAGEAFDWSEYAGKTVLVDFWATWCGPCVREIPALKRLYEAYHEKGFDIIGISLDRARAPLEEFVKDRELPWPILFEDTKRNPVAEYYGVMGIPLMILVGPDGKVVSTRARGQALEEMLEARFGPIVEEP